MRRSAVVQHPRGLEPHDHLCWTFDQYDEFHSRAGEFLREGLSHGQQVWYVAAGEPQTLAGHLRHVDGWDAAVADRAARIVPLATAYASAPIVDPHAQVHAFAAAAGRARAAGFTGLRVAADCTPLVATDRHAAAFARYEHLVDHLMTTQPITGMCAYHRGRVAPRTLARLSCLHPNTNTPGGFRLFAGTDGAAALAGELDIATLTPLEDALADADPRPVDGQLTIDATEVGFLDHTTLLRLADHAARHHATLLLRTRWRGAARLVDLLELSGVRVEVAA